MVTVVSVSNVRAEVDPPSPPQAARPTAKAIATNAVTMGPIIAVAAYAEDSVMGHLEEVPAPSLARR